MFQYGAAAPVEEEEDDPTVYKGQHGHPMPFHGNRQTMNLNPLILTNIQGSPYYKVELFKKRSFHEVVDEIYYKVDHLEPWERGSRGGAGMRTTGMCGGVRGVSAGGIVSSAFCLLYKLFTLKLTENQATALLNHQDSPYIRGLGFMYIRFTQPPGDIWSWFEPYMEDQEQIDVKAGGGKAMAMGDFLKLMLTKLEWFDTRFPRIPVNVEKEMRERMDEISARAPSQSAGGGWAAAQAENNKEEIQEVQRWENKDERKTNSNRRTRSPSSEKSKRGGSREAVRSRDRSREKDKDCEREKKKSRDRSREKDRKRKKDRSRSRSKDRTGKRDKDRSRDRSREKDRSKDKDRKRGKDRSRERSRERNRSKDKDHKRKKDRSRSSDRSKKTKSKHRDRSGSRNRGGGGGHCDRGGGQEDYSEYAEQLRRFKKLKRKERRSRSRS